MTREEAIHRLKNTAWLGTDKDREETEQAMNMAIEALSADAEQVTGKLNNRDDSFLTADAEAVKERKSKLDLIGRQDAIEAVATVTMSMHLSNVLCDKLLALPSADAVQIQIKLEKRYPQSRDEDITDAFMRGYLAGRSSADRPTGEWQKEIKGNGWNEWAVLTCDQCGAVIKDPTFETNYCPSCGAKMGGDTT